MAFKIIKESKNKTEMKMLSKNAITKRVPNITIKGKVMKGQSDKNYWMCNKEWK